MYHNTPRWAYLFQSKVLLDMLNIHLSPQKEPIKIMERSLLSGPSCFAMLLHKQGALTDFENGVFRDWCKDLVDRWSIKVDLAIYLRANPDVCALRVDARSRDGESAISLDYLQALHALHESWLNRPEVPPPHIDSVMMLDANATPQEVCKQFFEELSHIHSLPSPIQSTLGNIPH